MKSFFVMYLSIKYTCSDFHISSLHTLNFPLIKIQGQTLNLKQLHVEVTLKIVVNI